jgi:protease-4
MVTGMIGLGGISLVLIVVIGLRDAILPDFTKTHGEKIGVVEITGPIIESKETIRQLKQFREDDAIKAIVVRIESPGGGVGPSQEIYREVRKTVSEKTVVASMGAIAASGGYYIAAGTNGIMANPGTITGSIGVIIGYTNFESLFQKIGLAMVVIKSGEFKDIGSPARQMTDKEKTFLQEFVNKTRTQFVRDVSEGRGKTVSEIDPLADGRIFTGEEAKENGLVDRIGNLEDALDWAGQLAGVTGKIAAVYGRPQELGFLNYLTDSLVNRLSLQLAESWFRASYLFSPNAAEP